MDELLQLNNKTVGNNLAYEWYFCEVKQVEGNFNSKRILVDEAIGNPLYSTTVMDNGKLYTFIPGRSLNKIQLLIKSADNNYEFLHSVPISIRGDEIESPIHIDVFYDDVFGEWRGIVVSIDDHKAYLLRFGDNLENSPISTEISGDLGLNYPVNSKVIKEGDNWLVFIVNNTVGQYPVKILNYGASFANEPIITDLTITGSNTLSTIDFAKGCGEKIAFITSRGNHAVYKLDFVSSYLSTPLVSSYSGEDYSMDSPGGLDIVEEGGNKYLFVQSRNGPFYRLDFDLNWSNMPQFAELTNPTGLNRNWGVEFFMYEDKYYFFTVYFNGGRLYLSEVEDVDTCSASEAKSTEPNPTISYSQPGTYPITLTAYDENGNSSSITKEITVTSNIAPTIDFASTGNCVTNAIRFTPTSDQTISSWSWDFGDTQALTGQNVTHQYTTPGTYTVRLTVESENGCGNFIEKEIMIYPEPTPSFTPLSGNICTHKNYFFENTTPGDYEGNISYEWFVNGTSVSTDMDLNYEFTSGRAKEVKLIASIPGCAVETVQNITNVYEGAQPSFTVTDNCIGTLFEFANTSTGATTSTHWDFGNGFTSSLESPSYQYTTPDAYDVTLTLTNAAGCETQVTQTLTVFERPVVQFTNDLACEGIITVFTDKTTVGDANIASWSWDFDDPDADENSSEDRHPNHIFTTSGSFNVQLVAESTNGCRDSLQQVVQILPSPVADFDFDKVCIDEAIQFEDLSQPVPGEAITSWAWDLDGEFSAALNPQSTFEVEGDYEIGLTVSSENLCTATLYKTITVDPVPDVAFGVEDACDNEEVHFFDTTVGNIAQRSWDFARLGSSVDSSAFYRFQESGNYRVDLMVTTGNGCNYEGSQVVIINPAPTAAFKPSMTFGAPPLDVKFTNESTATDSYFWSFGDGEIATVKEPSHTFAEKDTYDVQLIVTDPNDCKDTTVRQINILDPHLELAVEQLFITDSPSRKNLLLTLRNNGTLIIDSVQVDLELGNKLITNEVIVKTILPGEQVNQLLDISFTNRDLKYLCVTVNSMIEGIEDDVISNNTKCVGLKGEIIILSPYPNPGKEELHLRIITEAQDEAFIRLYDVRGEMVKKIQYPSLYAGINDLLIQVDDMKSGIYILKASCGDQEGIFRVMIE